MLSQRAAMLLFIAIWGSSSRMVAQDQKVPSPVVTKEKESELRKLYAKELASKEKDTVDKLLKDGLETRDDPAAQFQLFMFSYQKAIEVFDFSAAFKISDELGRRYSDLNAIGLRSRALEDARKRKPKGDQLEQLVNGDIDYAVQAMGMGRQNSSHFDEAARAAKNAGVGAKGIKIKFLEDKAEAIQKYAADLSKDKDDGFSMAKFRYFILGESHEEVLGALSNGSDAKLKKLAGLQVVAGKGAGNYYEFGDVAYEAANENGRLAFERLKLLNEARNFYERVVSEASGAEKTRYERDEKLKKRRAEIEAKLTPFAGRNSGPTQGLVGFWSFDEGAGTAVRDQSPQANPGTQSGAGWAKGTFGGALSFNGKDSFVNLGVSGMPEIQGPKSILFWYRNEAIPGPSIPEAQVMVGLASDGGATTIGFWQSKLMVWSDGGGRLGAAPPPSVSKWHHFAYTFDGTIGKVYVDGALQDTCKEKPQSGPCKRLELGRWIRQQHFSGLLDELRIYNRALSETEVQSISWSRN